MGHVRIIVTGAAGFIGSRLSHQLLDEGHSVIGVDCFTPYYDVEVKRGNLQPLLRRDEFRFIGADLRSESLSFVAGADVVCHLAAQPGVRASWGPAFSGYLEHNLLATQRLLEVCIAGSVRRFVFASSSSVYGSAERYPTPEDGPCRPISPCGVTKLAAEKLVEAYATNFGLSAVALRYFTVYGPGQRPDMAFHRFITAALQDRPIEVFGDGEQTRDVTYVDDAVRATITAAHALDVTSPVNVGGGSHVSVNQVVELLEDILGRHPKVIRRDPALGDVRQTRADLTRARRSLHYNPSIAIEEGLPRQIEWLQATMGQ